MYFSGYSCPSLVWPNTEELISRPFLGENRFWWVLQNRMSTENAVGCLFFSHAHFWLQLQQNTMVPVDVDGQICHSCSHVFVPCRALSRWVEGHVVQWPTTVHFYENRSGMTSFLNWIQSISIPPPTYSLWVCSVAWPHSSLLYHGPSVKLRNVSMVREEESSNWILSKEGIRGASQRFMKTILWWPPQISKKIMKIMHLWHNTRPIFAHTQS